MTTAGNAEPVDSEFIAVQAPGVTLTSPVDGTTVTGSVTLSASVTGMIVDHRSSSSSGRPWSGTDTIAPYSISWDSTTVADGPRLDPRPCDGHSDRSPLIPHLRR